MIAAHTAPNIIHFCGFWNVGNGEVQHTCMKDAGNCQELEIVFSIFGSFLGPQGGNSKQIGGGTKLHRFLILMAVN